MGISQFIHIPVITLINLAITYFWNLKLRNRAFRSRSVWALATFGSLFNIWGLDVLQREFVIDSVPEMIRLSVGAWLVFVLATNAKYMAIYGWSKREFWLDYGGDLVGFVVCGILIFIAT